MLSLDVVNQPIAFDEQPSNRLIAQFGHQAASVGEPSERARSRLNLIDESGGIARRILCDVVGCVLQFPPR